jgi:hypothetical protein
VHFSRPTVQTLREREPARETRQTKMPAGSMAVVRLLRHSMKTGSSMAMMLVAAMQRPPVRCRLLPGE